MYAFDVMRMVFKPQTAALGRLFDQQQADNRAGGRALNENGNNIRVDSVV
jgi:hypothetical protein